MKKIFAALLVLLMLSMSFLTVYAENGKVTYKGGAENFIFSPGSDKSPTDIFPLLKDVMPGDSLTQTIKVRNDRSKEVKVDIYLRSLGAGEGSEDFLSQLHLKVQKKSSTVMFNAAANETAGLTDWVKLGTLYSGGEVELLVTLEVPVTLGNEYMDQTGYIEWEFMVEEFPVDPDDPRPPKTGDSTGIFATIAAVACLLLLILFFFFKKKKEREEMEVKQ